MAAPALGEGLLDAAADWLGLTPATLAVLGVLLMGLVAATLIAQWLAGGHAERARTELEARISTWWIIVLLVAGALALGTTASIVLFGFVSYLALKEYFSIIPTRRIDRAILLLVYLAIPFQYWLVGTRWYGLFAVFIPVYMLMFLGTAMVVLGQTEGFLKAAGTLHWGLASTVYSLSHVAYLLVLMDGGGHAAGAALVVALLVLTEGNDVAQYVWGKALGRRKILPTVSPRKTWEGFIGGVATSALLGFLLLPWLTPYQGWAALGMGALLAIAGFFGDVTISAVKRDLGVKDSGTLLPGHGGILDRVDSLIFTAPLFFHLTRYLHT